MSENRSSIRIIVLIFAVTTISALYIAGSASLSGSVRKFLGLPATAVAAQSSIPGNQNSDDPVTAPNVTNGKIVFRGLGSGATIFMVDPAAPGGEIQIGPGNYPVWKPDGSAILFIDPTSLEGEVTNTAELKLMNPDGSNVRSLATRTYTVSFNDGADWSPDGTKITFIRSTTSGSFSTDIWMMNADGSGQTKITNSTHADQNPSWSPDGTKIAFTKGLTSGAQIYTVTTAVPFTETTLTNLVNLNSRHPHWSPDGTKIAIESDRDNGFQGRPDIYVINGQTGAQLQRVTNDNYDDHNPVYSPDGTQIVWQSGSRPQTSNNKLFVMPSNGNPVSAAQQTLITSGTNFDFSPSWGQSTGTPTPTPTPCATFTNTTAIIVPATGSTAGPSSPYPANIPVTGMNGTITNVTVKLKNFSHSYPDDVDVLLVGPGGQNAIIMSDVGGGNAAAGITLTFADGAAGLPDEGALTSGTFRPTNINEGSDPFAAPAPTPAGGSTLSVFNGTAANGTWSLYVIDDAEGDTGNFNGGWELGIRTTNCPAVTGCVTFTGTSGPSAWYQGEGTANDRSGNNNNGTLLGGTTFTTSGRVNQAFDFNGTNAGVQIPDSPFNRPTSITVDTWVRFTSLDSMASVAGLQYLVFHKNTRTSGFEAYALLKDRTSGVDHLALVITAANGAQAAIRSSTVVTPSTWYHVAGTYDGTTARLYINGVQEASSTVSLVMDYAARPLFLGTTGETFDGKLNGQLDEAHIFPRALSAAEVQSIASAATTGICATPLPVINTNGLSPSTATAGGPGFTLTVNGANFVNGSIVRFKGIDRVTTFVSSTQLTAQILASDIQTGGALPVTVFNPGTDGGTSNAVNFIVPFTATLSFDGLLADRVGKSDAGVNPDGELDGTFSLSLPGQTILKTIQSVSVVGPNGNEWDTIQQTTNIKWVAGVATTLESPLANSANGTIAPNTIVGSPPTYKIFLADNAPTSFAFGKSFTLIMTFSDGSKAIASTTIDKTRADVAITFTTSPPATVAFGSTVTFGFGVTNNGPDVAHGVVFTGAVDSKFTNIVMLNGIGCSISDHLIICNIGDVPFGTTSSVRFTAKATQAGAAINQAQVGVDDTRTFETTFVNNSVSANSTIGPPTVELIGLEVTQAVQDLANSVPLVADKPTFIRAYVKAATPAASGLIASAVLVGTNSAGVTNDRLQASNPGQTVKVLAGDGPKRSQLLDSFYFALPSGWIKAGTLQFRIESPDFSLVCEEPDGTPNCATTVTFQRMNKVSLNLIATTWTDAANVTHAPDLGDAITSLLEIQARLPMYEFDLEITSATLTGDPCSVLLGPMNNQILALRNSDIANGKAVKTFYMGLLADQITCASPTYGSNGIANGIPGNTAAVFIKRNGIVTVGSAAKPVMDGNSRAHELGHDLGLSHTVAPGQTDPFPATDYIPSDGRISVGRVEYAANTAYGFDIFDSSSNLDGFRIFPATTWDFMSYGRPRWVSAWNYTKLFNAIGTTNRPKSEYPSEETRVTVTDSVIVSGSVLTNPDSGVLSPLFVKTTNSTIALPTPGSYTVRFENSTGQTLAAYPFEPFIDTDGNKGPFSLVLPWDAATTRIRLLRNGQELTSRTASAAPPSVTVTSPNGGETLNGNTATFSWVASDPDANALTYSLDYSPDVGATWTTLATNLSSTTLTANISNLAASAQGLIRVTASDGFRSSHDESNAVFTVPPHGPSVSIVSPSNNQIFVGQQPLNLTGLGYDIEDGLLAGSSFAWSSNLNGPLGTGNSISVNAANLLEGTHTITLTATDSTSRIGTASVSINVFRTRPNFPAMLSVGATGLTFSADVGSGVTPSQTLAIRNGGDGDLTWSATADQPWIQLGSASGTAPSNAEVNINPAGLAAGNYQGTITVTGNAANSPQLVTVSLVVVPPSTVTGRVVTPSGLGLRNAVVSLITTQGVRRTATTSSFGLFSFGNVANGDTYTISISSKRYRFASRVVQVFSNITLPDFVGLE